MSNEMNFRNLSDSQSSVFEQIATGNDAGHSKRTLDSLMRKGLIRQFQQSQVDHIGQFYVYRYEVPLDVHIEWCEWCSQQPTAEAVKDWWVAA